MVQRCCKTLSCLQYSIFMTFRAALSCSRKTTKWPCAAAFLAALLSVILMTVTTWPHSVPEGRCFRITCEIVLKRGSIVTARPPKGLIEKQPLGTKQGRLGVELV